MVYSVFEGKSDRMEKYFEYFRKTDNGKAILFCFPHAGGNSTAFADWVEFIDERYDICVLSLPGRGKKALDPAFSNMDEMLQHLLSEIVQYLDKPFIFFGHSMGALISYELAVLLEINFNNKPEHLYLSSYPAPHIPNQNLIKEEMNDTELIHMLKELNGTPKELLIHKKFFKTLLPTIRSDYRTLNSYNFKGIREVFSPITALLGTEDNFPFQQAKEWCKYTGLTFEIKSFPGDHFYLSNQEVKQVIGGLVNKKIFVN